MLFEHDMVEPVAGQIPADGQTGLPAADDDDGTMGNGGVMGGHEQDFHSREMQRTDVSSAP